MHIGTALIALFLIVPVAHADDMYGTTEPSQASPAAEPDTAQAGDKKKECEKKWRRYRESQACFARYRLVDGGVKAEAFKHCAEVKQPEFCE